MSKIIIRSPTPNPTPKAIAITLGLAFYIPPATTPVPLLRES